MTLTVTLPETTVEVVAGGSVPVPVLVANQGPSPVRVALELSGRAAPWLRLAAATPPEVDLTPGESRTLTLLLVPPRGAAVPGQLVPFRVRAESLNGAGSSAVATGLVLISTPVPVRASLEPATARTTAASRHVVELTTDDPTGVLVTLRGSCASPSATVTVEPVAVRVEPGRAARADVTVRPRHPALLRSRDHAFEVVWETDTSDGLARGTAGGRLVQPPVLPPPVTLVVVLALVLLLGSAAAALWPGPSGGGGPESSQADASASVGDAPPASETVPDVPVVVHSHRIDPADPEASHAAAVQRVDGLRLPDGARIEVVASSTVDWEAGYWLVIVRGLADRAAVDAVCGDLPAGLTTCRPLV